MSKIKYRTRGAGGGCMPRIGCLALVFLLAAGVIVWVMFQAGLIRYTGEELTGGTLFDTESRDYYALEYRETETAYYLDDFYTKFDGKWVHEKMTLSLEKDAYQYIKISRNVTVRDD